MRKLHTDSDGRVTSYEDTGKYIEPNIDAIIDWTAAIVLLSLIAATAYFFLNG